MAISSRRRPGFTLVELLVVITIIGMLVALLLPAVQTVRERGRQVQCLNNLKNIALAAINHDSSKGQLPALSQFIKRGNKDYASVGSDAKSVVNVQISSPPATLSELKGIVGFSWATVLMPRLERADIWDQISQPPDPTLAIPMPPIATLICPSDNDVNSQPDLLGLSYSANSGGWDPRNANGDLNVQTNIGDTVDNGVFFDNAGFERIGRKAPTNRISGMKDGAGTTLMFAENIHKSYFSPTSAPLFSWLAGSNAGIEQQLGFVWVVPKSGTAPTPGNTINDQERIGGNAADLVDFDATIPRFARPASAHGSGANVAFCDGHSMYLRDDIDYKVYQQLVTPNGRKCVDSSDHLKGLNKGEPIYEFRIAPPLAEKDYQ
jgi:prepilin-type N-terminal cleavage/methylation domain-containing protein/prepilin-type processing-associated H-X9-DG protein